MRPTSFATVAPGKFWEVNEGGEEVEECPGDYNDVVDVLQEHHHDGRVSNTLEDGRQLTNNGHPALANVLAQGDFEEEERDAADEHGEEVGDQERS